MRDNEYESSLDDDELALFNAEICAVNQAILDDSFPLAYATIQECQKADKEITKFLKDKKDTYKETSFPSSDKSFTLVTKNQG